MKPPEFHASTLKKRIALILFFGLSFSLWGQVSIHGSIKDQQGLPIDDAMIMIVKNGGTSVFNFTNSDEQGRYLFQHNSKDDSLYVRVTRLDYAPQLVRIANRSQLLDFSLVQQATELKEVVVRPKGVWRNRDTVNYSVSSYAEQNDRSISDILRKLPGIEIKPSGVILYNNEPIQKFYVEGLDLMGGKYSVISENLKYENVQSVQILENHEPIKALEEVSLSDRAALNIVLKEEAKSIWQSALKLGLGVAPLLWDSELTLMRFAKNNQDVIVYKTNNIGISSSRELTAHYGILGGYSSNAMLGIPVPESGISENRSLFNRQHLITANRLIKLNEKYQLRFNANYLNDRHEKNSSTHQRHFLDGSEMITDEQTQLINRIHRGDLTLTLTGNHPQYFLENALHLQGDWANASAHVNRSEQGLKSPSYTLSDDFRWLKVIGKKRLDIQSNNKLSSTAQALHIQPGPYADFFNDSLPYEYLRQEVDLLYFKSSSSVSFSMSRGRWQSNYDLGLDLDVQHLHSGLSVAGQASADTLSNAYRFLLAKPYLAARYSYTNKKLTVSLSLPLGYAFQQSKEASNESSHTRNRPYLHPFFNLRYKIGYQWEISSSARFSNSFNTIKDLYTGYLLSDYRSISKNDGSFSGGHSQAYNVGISYNEPLRSITAGISARYGRSHYDKLPEISYDGILSIRKLVESDGYNDTKAFGFNISKGIGSFITKINLHGSYLISSGHQQLQGLVLTSKTQGYSLNLNLDGKITSFVNYIYTLAYNRSHTDIEGTSSTPMGKNSRMQQNLRINVFPTQALTFGLIMNYSQSTTTYKLPSTFFMDLRAQYKFKRWELHLSWNNMLNAQKYVVVHTSDFISSVNTFELRPANVVVSVRFSL